MKYLIIILFPFILSSQNSWDKIKQRDDILHVDGSWLLTMTASEITYYFTNEMDKSIIAGTLTVPVIGILGKEIIHDKVLGLGVFSTKDIFYDIWGTLIGIIVEVCWIDYRQNRDYNYKIKNDYRKHILD